MQQIMVAEKQTMTADLPVYGKIQTADSTIYGLLGFINSLKIINT